MDFVDRDLRGALLANAKRYPVITVFGPRQSGKTTLVRSVFPDHGYCNLEDPELRALATQDPKEFLRRHRPPGAIKSGCSSGESRRPVILFYGQGAETLVSAVKEPAVAAGLKDRSDTSVAQRATF